MVPTFSQAVILGRNFMLDYDLVPYTVNLTEELPQDLKFPLKRPPNGAIDSVRILATERITIPRRYTYATMTYSHMTTNVDYVFSLRSVLRRRLRILKRHHPARNDY